MKQFYELSYQNSIIYRDSYITVKVSRTGIQYVFNGGTYFTKPNEVWIDTDKKEFVQNNYNIIPTNIIILKWTSEIIVCKYMFYNFSVVMQNNRPTPYTSSPSLLYLHQKFKLIKKIKYIK